MKWWRHSNFILEWTCEIPCCKIILRAKKAICRARDALKTSELPEIWVWGDADPSFHPANIPQMWDLWGEWSTLVTEQIERHLCISGCPLCSPCGDLAGTTLPSPRSAPFIYGTESPKTEIPALFCLKLCRNNQKASAWPKLATFVPTQCGLRAPEATQGRHGHHQDLPVSFPEEKMQTRTAKTSPHHCGGANKANPSLTLPGEVLGGFVTNTDFAIPKYKREVSFSSLLCCLYPWSVFCQGFGGGKAWAGSSCNSLLPPVKGKQQTQER